MREGKKNIPQGYCNKKLHTSSCSRIIVVMHETVYLGHASTRYTTFDLCDYWMGQRSHNTYVFAQGDHGNEVRVHSHSR